MTYITGHDRSQLLLLPEAVDDYVDAGNPVRFIDAFVDGLDLAAAGVRASDGEGDGRPVEALYLRLSESGAVEPPAGARSPQRPPAREATGRNPKIRVKGKA